MFYIIHKFPQLNIEYIFLQIFVIIAIQYRELFVFIYIFFTCRKSGGSLDESSLPTSSDSAKFTQELQLSKDDMSNGVLHKKLSEVS